MAARLTAIRRDNGIVSVARARATLSAFFVWAMQQGYVESNPVLGTGRVKENPTRERVLTEHELAAIWRACDDTDYGRIVRLLILTGCRRKEIGGMAWGEIDWELAKWTLPARRSKNKRAHTLPLMPMALDIIRSVPRRVSRDHLFGDTGRDGFASWGDGKRALDLRTEISGWTVHDLRRSTATQMANIGVMPHIIEQVFEPPQWPPCWTGGYLNRSSYDREVRTALAQWADHIRTLVEGGERKILPYTPVAS